MPKTPAAGFANSTILGLVVGAALVVAGLIAAVLLVPMQQNSQCTADTCELQSVAYLAISTIPSFAGIWLLLMATGNDSKEREDGQISSSFKDYT